MKLNKNKYIPIGIVCLVLAIILNKTSNISDLVIGILYGLSIGILLLELLIVKSNSQFVE
ncbi:hypothetical protein E4T68_02965 [Granulicatella sp. WM01]|nr:hypothetical protein E4T68_02965 [Granulicatella sp. WM01]